MDSRFRPLPAAVLLALLAFLHPLSRAGADVEVERTAREKVTRPLGEVQVRVRRQQVLLAADRVRIDDLLSGERLIFRLDRGLLWRVDPNAGTYSEVTFEALAVAESAFRDELRQVCSRLDPASEEAHRVGDLLAALEAAAAAGPEVQPVAEADAPTVAGEATAHQRIVAGGRALYDGWFVAAPAEGAAWFRALAAVHAMPTAPCAALGRLGKLPLRASYSLVLFRDRLDVDEEVSRLRRDPIPPEEFDLPAGLRQVDLPGYQPLGIALAAAPGALEGAPPGQDANGNPKNGTEPEKKPRPREGRGDRHQ